MEQTKHFLDRDRLTSWLVMDQNEQAEPSTEIFFKNQWLFVDVR